MKKNFFPFEHLFDCLDRSGWFRDIYCIERPGGGRKFCMCMFLNSVYCLLNLKKNVCEICDFEEHGKIEILEEILTWV